MCWWSGKWWNMWKVNFLLLSIFSFACGNHWEGIQPFKLQIDSPEILAKEANEVFEASIKQMGGTVADFGTQVVHIVYDADCTHDIVKCPTCNPRTLAHVEQLSADTIRVCPRAIINSDIFKKVILHEMGHIMGQWDHLPMCNMALNVNRSVDPTFNVMCPDLSCYLSIDRYTDVDIAFICSADRMSTKVCGK